MPSPTKKLKKELKPLSARARLSISRGNPKLPTADGSLARSQPQFDMKLWAQPGALTQTPSHGTSKSSQPKPVPVGAGKHRIETVDLTSDDEITLEAHDAALWVDKYAPRNRDELGVHPKKVDSVAGWFDEAYNPRLAKYRRLLVLAGPAGAAKTATLRLLAQESNVEIIEFRNAGNTSVANDSGRESLVNHFTSFLARAGMAPALELTTEDKMYAAASTSTKSSFASPTSRRLILLEDLPNIAHKDTKDALQSALLQYLKSPRVTCPLVLIISEALARPGIGPDADSATVGFPKNDSVDARSVCGIDILESPGCRTITFRPVAPTIMKKALNKLLDRIYSSNGDLNPSLRPSATAVEVISSHSNGDIRSAIMSLQFLASNPSMAKSKGMTDLAVGHAPKKRKKGDAGGVSKEQVKELLQFVSAREDSLFIFHALGKVLYSKRWGQRPDDDKKDLDRPGILQECETKRLPRHLREKWSRAPSKVDPDVLFAEAPVDSDVFVTYIQHNYPQFTNEVEECAGIMDGLSEADALMRMEGDDRLSRVALTSQYSFNVAVRSTMLNLPQPVPRRRQELRKSEYWAKTRLQRSNENGIEEMYRKKDGLALVPPTGLSALTSQAVGKFAKANGQNDEERHIGQDEHDWSGGGGTQRSRQCLTIELVPFIGKIRKPGTTHFSPFLTQLAMFPKPPQSSKDYSILLKGEALGENDATVDDDDQDGGEQDDEWENRDNEWSSLETQGVEEILIDPTDDIQDV
ncbi:RFC checkpoint protein Rad17 [Microbotryomycetes sp. JL201]|nr:RFC checkpoint protein Rad17 [Microbotryomycetes sp. JL201]